jgi:hypothetical protein
MKIEDFDKIFKVKERLDALKVLRHEIGVGKSVIIYAEQNPYHYDEYRIFSSDCIKDILKRHDEQIRKELDEEIDKVYKEIEEL